MQALTAMAHGIEMQQLLRLQGQCIHGQHAVHHFATDIAWTSIAASRAQRKVQCQKVLIRRMGTQGMRCMLTPLHQGIDITGLDP